MVGFLNYHCQKQIRSVLYYKILWFREIKSLANKIRFLWHSCQCTCYRNFIFNFHREIEINYCCYLYEIIHPKHLLEFSISLFIEMILMTLFYNFIVTSKLTKSIFDTCYRNFIFIFSPKKRHILLSLYIRNYRKYMFHKLAK